MLSIVLSNILPLLKKYWTYVALLLCLITLYFLFTTIKSKNIEIARKTSNIEVLNDTVKHYKVSYNTGLKTIHKKDSIILLNAASIQGLNYTISEYEQFRSADLETIKALNLKLKNVSSVTNIGTQTNQVIHTSTIKTDSTVCFNYKDKYLSLFGCVKNDSTAIAYQSSDSLTIIPSSIPKHHFLWWSWGVKGIKLDVISMNPNTSFTYERYIELKK